MKTTTKILYSLLVILLCLTANTVQAQTLPEEKNATSGLPPTAVTTSGKTAETLTTEVTKRRPIALGAEIGASIDLSGTESSCFDIDVYAGYRNQLIQCAGVGIGIHPSFAHKRMFIPIYAMFRCNFKPGKSLMFFDVKAGISINNLTPEAHNAGAYASGGLGFNLASTRRFSSYAIVGYNFTQITPFFENDKQHDLHAMHSVSIRIGITF